MTITRPSPPSAHATKRPMATNSPASDATEVTVAREPPSIRACSRASAMTITSRWMP